MAKFGSNFRCRKGSLVEFKLEPVYSKAASEFYCSVQPVKNQLLVRFEYSVEHKGQLLNKKSVSLFGDENWLAHGHSQRRFVSGEKKCCSHLCLSE